MRISVKKTDPGFAKYVEWLPHSLFAQVFLDGAEMKNICVTADEELGEVLVFVLDHNGKPIVDGDEYRREWRRGKVEIVMPERKAA